MKRILMILDTDFTKDERVQNEAAILTAAGYQLTVLHLVFSGSKDNNNNNKNLKAIPIHVSRKWRNRWYFFSNITNKYYRFWADRIEDEINKNDYDAIHFHDLYMWKAALLLKNRDKFALVLDLHENYPEAVLNYRWATRLPHRFFVQPGAWKTFERKNLPKTDRLIVLSNFFKQELLKKHTALKADHLIVYPNVPDTKKLLEFEVRENVLPKESNDFFVLYFGGVSKRRGVFTAIDSLKYIDHQKFNVKLIIIGPIDQVEKSQFEKVISHKSCESSIVYIPWIDIQELPSYLNMADVCISPIFKNPQHESGIANKVFQYMLFERPVIVSNCRPQASVVENAKCGLVFKSEDSIDLAEKIIMLMNDENRRKEMGANGKKAVIEQYNTLEAGGGLIKMYESLE